MRGVGDTMGDRPRKAADAKVPHIGSAGDPYDESAQMPIIFIATFGGMDSCIM